MTADPALLFRLLQISDSSFPSGGFAFSNGLETLAGEGSLASPQAVEGFLREQLIPRWTGFDRWFLAEALLAGPDLAAIGALDRACESQSCVAPLAESSRRMGRAALSSHARMGTPFAADYLASVRAAALPGHLPVAQGAIAAGLGLPRDLAEVSSLYQLVAGALSAALRLGRLGALQAQEIQVALGPSMAAALATPLPPAPHAFAPLADIAAMRRGQGRTRLFAA